MTTMALVALKYDVKLYIFELMSNHIHIVLSANGETCLKVFSYLTRRISAQLIADGFPPLPKGYDFRMIPIQDRSSFRNHILYAARNPYEKGICIPGTYPWGSDYLLFNPLSAEIQGKPVCSMSDRKVRRCTKSIVGIPGHWEYHPVLGLLPKNYISIEKIRKLFPSVKSYLTGLIKDYEAFLHLSHVLDEPVSLTEDEQQDLLLLLLRRDFHAGSLAELSREDRGKLAVRLCDGYRLGVPSTARLLGLPERIVTQLIRSKEFNKLLATDDHR